MGWRIFRAAESLLPVSTLLVMQSAAGSCFAQDAAAAEALFRQARDDYKLGNLELACPRFKAAYALDPTAGTLLNIAACEEHLGDIAGAWQHYRELRERLPAEDSRQGLVHERLAELERRLPFLVITHVSARHTAVSVLIDGARFGSESFGVELPVNPGAHQIEVHSDGHHPRRYDLSVSEGRRHTLFVEPGAPLAKERPVEPIGHSPPGPTSSGSRLPETRTGQALPASFWVSSAVGTAGLLVGGLAGVMALSRSKTVNEECVSDRVCSETGYAAEDSGRRYATISTAGFAVGVVGVVVSTLLWLETRSNRTHQVTVQVRPRENPRYPSAWRVDWGIAF